jgi:cytochrome c peroxidase
VDEGRAGVDNEPTSPGAFGKRGDRNSPTVFNAALHLAQFWDGRAADLKAGRHIRRRADAEKARHGLDPHGIDPHRGLQ